MITRLKETLDLWAAVYLALCLQSPAKSKTSMAPPDGVVPLKIHRYTRRRFRPRLPPPARSLPSACSGTFGFTLIEVVVKFRETFAFVYFIAGGEPVVSLTPDAAAVAIHQRVFLLPKCFGKGDAGVYCREVMDFFSSMINNFASRYQCFCI